MIKTVDSVLFDASNLVSGGGVQVAASLMDELIELRADREMLLTYTWLERLEFIVSPEVMANSIRARECDASIRVRRMTVRHLRRWLPGRYRAAVHFVVFGPRYGFRRGKITVVGVADGTSFYHPPVGIPKLPSRYRVKRAIRAVISRILFSRETYLVSESKSLIHALQQKIHFPSERIRLIPNVVNRAVIDVHARKHLPVRFENNVTPETLLIGYVARVYPHKNHEFLAAVHRELRGMDIQAKFVLTLNNQEWESCSSQLRAACINVGPISVDQVADFNARCDAMIFPSLLESHSATPMESLATNGLLFASDREFVKDSAGDAPVYIDPLDPHSSARVIRATLSDGSLVRAKRAQALKQIESLPGPRERALSYLQLFDEILSKGAITESTSN